MNLNKFLVEKDFEELANCIRRTNNCLKVEDEIKFREKEYEDRRLRELYPVLEGFEILDSRCLGEAREEIDEDGIEEYIKKVPVGFYNDFISACFCVLVKKKEVDEIIANPIYFLKCIDYNNYGIFYEMDSVSIKELREIIRNDNFEVDEIVEIYVEINSNLIDWGKTLCYNYFRFEQKREIIILNRKDFDSDYVRKNIIIKKVEVLD